MILVTFIIIESNAFGKLVRLIPGSKHALNAQWKSKGPRKYYSFEKHNFIYTGAVFFV